MRLLSVQTDVSKPARRSLQVTFGNVKTNASNEHDLLEFNQKQNPVTIHAQTTITIYVS